MATAFGAPLKDKPICFAGVELGAKRHICVFFYVPPDEFVTELQQRREARKDSS